MNRIMPSILVLGLLVAGCEDRAVDLVDQAPDASTSADALPADDALPDTSPQEVDAGLDCGPDTILFAVYTHPGCDTEPEKICVGMMGGDRHVHYCTCEDPHISNDLGWEQGGIAPWFAKGYGLYTEPGCDGSVIPICLEDRPLDESATYCWCNGNTAKGPEQGTIRPFSARGPCDAGSD